MVIDGCVEGIQIERTISEKITDFANFEKRQLNEDYLMSWKLDRDAQEILKVQEKVAKLISGKITERQIPSLRRKLLELSAEHAGTIVERDVDRALAQLGTGKD